MKSISVELINITKYFKLKFQRNFLMDSFSYSKRSSQENKNKLVLNQINLKFYQDEVVGIIGSNGAGKSTLSRLIYGLIEPTEGKVLRNGKIHAIFGYGGGFISDLSGRDNLFLVASAYGLTKTEINAIYADIVSFAELSKDNMQLPLKHFSNGMKARLGFSIACHIPFDVLILDEALTGGDVHFRLKSLKKLEEIFATKGKTFILVSHNEEVIKKHCSRVIILHNGRVDFDGDPDIAYNRYNKQVR